MAQQDVGAGSRDTEQQQIDTISHPQLITKPQRTLTFRLIKGFALLAQLLQGASILH